ncbi:MAG: hypothetical protein RLZZ283_411 [Candidatus Parcubacteria bacterium]|jgi:hypothetical protein
MTEHKRSIGLVSADLVRVWREKRLNTKESGHTPESWKRALELDAEETRLRNEVPLRRRQRLVRLAKDQQEREMARESQSVSGIRRNELWQRRHDVLAFQRKRDGAAV